MLRFFSFLGSKQTIARDLGPPRHSLVMEPCMGSLGYSCHWGIQKVIAFDVDPILVTMWNWIKDCTPEEVMALPDVVENVDDLNCADGAKHCIGFWMKHVSDRPAKVCSQKMIESQLKQERWAWRPAIKERIIKQAPFIQNWEFILGDYSDAPDVEAHWHIDPPYQHLKGFYGAKIDYTHLGEFCKSRRGAVDVCERSDATWLDFRPYRANVNEGKRYRTNQFHDVVFRMDEWEAVL